MSNGHKGHDKRQMSDREAMKLALEALVDFGWHIENCPQFPTWAEPKKHPSCTCGYDKAIAALRQALEQTEQPRFFYGQDPNVLPASDKGESRE